MPDPAMSEPVLELRTPLDRKALGRRKDGSAIWLAALPQGAMLQMAASGPEANFAAPRTDPHRWTVKLRTKSTHMAMLGVEMPDMSGVDGDDRAGGQAAAGSPAEQKAGRKRGLLKGLGRSVLGGIM